MIRNNINIFVCLTLLILTHLQCSNDKTMSPTMEKAEFKITPCEITYNGKPIPVGKPISAWVELFGENYTRNFYESTYIWDDLGIAIINRNITHDMKNVNDYEHRKYDYLYIFFANLESHAGQKGILKHAYGRKSAEYVLNEYKENNIPIDEEKKQRILGYEKEGASDHKSNYIYPYKTYDKVIDVEGAPIQKGMTLKEVNNARKKAGLPIFSYWDLNMNMIEEGGHTKGDKGSYHDETFSIKSCQEKTDTLTYFVSIRYTDDFQPEYLEITTEVDFAR